MRRFNPDRELYKIRYGNRNKIIISICLLLLVGVIGYSFALYQVRHTKRIIYTTVSDFSNKDINLAVYVNNNKVEDFPNKDEEYIYDKIVCDNNDDEHVKAHWNYDKWALELETSKKAKCNVYFKTGTDKSGANPPELYQGLIPVTISDTGEIKVADTTKEWYNYSEHRWANAVLIDYEQSHSKYYKEDGSFNVGATMDLENDILQMYVWIPRYKYQLFNAVVGATTQEKMIEIKFERETETTGETRCEIASNGVETCIYDDNGKWYTHPAFKFGNTELKGIWVGKFESSGTTDNIKVIPNANSIRNINILNMHNASRNIESNSQYNLPATGINTHMMKNIEWGVVAYLTQSKYGRCENNECTEVTINGNNDYITGYANSSDQWDSENGVKASTTGNIYGIYDMNGGAQEYVMGNMVQQNGQFTSGSLGTMQISPEYYDAYKYNGNSNGNQDHSRGHLGDATREVLLTSNSSWYNDLASSTFVSQYHITYQFYVRGGAGTSPQNSGIFYFYAYQGSEQPSYSFRIVLTAQDGED